MVNTELSDKALCEAEEMAPPVTTAGIDVEAESEHGPTLDRRSLLRGIGATTAVSTLAALAAAKVQAQEYPAGVPRIRSQSTAAAAGPGVPGLPPIQVIAYNRMAFGPRPGDLHAFLQLGGTPDESFEAFVEQQLYPGQIDDSECDALIAAQGYKTLHLSLTDTWKAYVLREGEENKDNDRYLPVKEQQKATFYKAVYSKRQLEQVLADHWHNHFNIYGWEYWTAPTFVHYDRDVIRKHMLGNFRTMLEAVAQSPAMLYYLDNQSNEGGDPNENFARELFELHGMGAENYLGVRASNDPAIFDENDERLGYIDEDVYGATTCFTGWRVNGETGAFEFDDSRHFPFQKIVLGQEIPSFQGIKDGQDVLDLIVNHPGTARYICRRLCRRLISDNPPDSVVEAAATVFRNNLNAADQLRKVTRTILLSPEFRTTWAQKVKRPFEFSVSALRASQGDFYPEDRFFWSYDSGGQRLFRWSTPDGYPDYISAWTGTMVTLQRWRHVNFLTDWKYSDGPQKDQRRVDLVGQTPSAVTTPIQLVDFWSNRVLGRLLPPEEYEPIVEFMAFGRNPTQDLPEEDLKERLPYMVALIFMSPSFAWR